MTARTLPSRVCPRATTGHQGPRWVHEPVEEAPGADLRAPDGRITFDDLHARGVSLLTRLGLRPSDESGTASAAFRATGRDYGPFTESEVTDVLVELERVARLRRPDCRVWEMPNGQLVLYLDEEGTGDNMDRAIEQFKRAARHRQRKRLLEDLARAPSRGLTAEQVAHTRNISRSKLFRIKRKHS